MYLSPICSRRDVEWPRRQGKRTEGDEMRELPLGLIDEVLALSEGERGLGP
jgi:hypothetical protein